MRGPDLPVFFCGGDPRLLACIGGAAVILATLVPWAAAGAPAGDDAAM